MQKVELGKKIKINYVGKTESNFTFISSREKGPLTFVVGEYRKIKGLNKAVMGMKVGDTKKVEIGPEEGFGTRDKSLVVSLPLQRLPDGVKEGDIIRDSEAKQWIVREIDLQTNKALMDGNHPLAGESLIFDIEVVAIQ